MNIKISKSHLNGTINAISSKSYAHRILIASAFSNRPIKIKCNIISDDIKATILCLKALSAKIKYVNGYFLVDPCNKNILQELSKNQTPIYLKCLESATTYRFFVSIVAILGLNAYFILNESLIKRPMNDIFTLLSANGLNIDENNNKIHIYGKLQKNIYKIYSGLSSQFLSGLLLALSIKKEKQSIISYIDKANIDNSKNNVTSVSLGYVDMTIEILKKFNINIIRNGNMYIKNENETYISKYDSYFVEGDWSNSAFFIAAGIINPFNNSICIKGLDNYSTQKDKKMINILKKAGANIVMNDDNIICNSSDKMQAFDVDARDIPDLVPALSIVAANINGISTFYNVKRLFYKESNRIDGICNILKKFKIQSFYKNNILYIKGNKLLSNVCNDDDIAINPLNDHRLAMMATILACINGNVIIKNANCVNKSYPTFFKIFNYLGGKCKEIK